MTRLLTLPRATALCAAALGLAWLGCLATASATLTPVPASVLVAQTGGECFGSSNETTTCSTANTQCVAWGSTSTYYNYSGLRKYTKLVGYTGYAAPTLGTCANVTTYTNPYCMGGGMPQAPAQSTVVPPELCP